MPLTEPATTWRPSAVHATALTASSPAGACVRSTGRRCARTSYSRTSPRSRSLTKPVPTTSVCGVPGSQRASATQTGTTSSSSSCGTLRARHAGCPVATLHTARSTPRPPVASCGSPSPGGGRRATAAAPPAWKLCAGSAAPFSLAPSAAASSPSPSPPPGRHGHTRTQPARSHATTRADDAPSAPHTPRPAVPRPALACAVNSQSGAAPLPAASQKRTVPSCSPTPAAPPGAQHARSTPPPAAWTPQMCVVAAFSTSTRLSRPVSSAVRQI